MTYKASLIYATKFIFPKHRSAQKSNGRRSLFGAMLCIGISLIPLVAVLVVADGMIEGITGRIIGLSTQDLSVHINPRSSSVADYDTFIELSGRLSSVPGVLQVYPEMQGMALAASKDIRTGATVRAVPSDIFEKNEKFATLFELVEGTLDLQSPKNAILGQKIAGDLHVHAGDTFNLISINKVGELMTPRLTQFTVCGIVSCGYQELDALWIFVPLETGFKSLAVKSSQFLVGLVTPDAFAPYLMNIKKNVEYDLAGYNEDHPGVEYASVFSWNELNAAEYENFSSTKILLLLIMLLIVLVASVNISSAIVMIVMERRKEIAILKSVGASSQGVTMSFLFVGFAAGLGGTLIGIPLGLFAAVNVNIILQVMEKIVNFCIKIVYIISRGNSADFRNIRLLDPAYYLQNIPISIPFRELLVITLGTLLLSVLAAALPAIKAGKEKPLDTLRKM